MRNCQTNKSNRTRKRRNYTREQTGHKQNDVSTLANVDSQTLRIIFTQQQGIQWFDNGKQSRHSNEKNDGKNAHFTPREISQTSKTPENILLNLLRIAKESEYTDDSCGNGSKHQPND